MGDRVMTFSIPATSLSPHLPKLFYTVRQVQSGRGIFTQTAGGDLVYTLAPVGVDEPHLPGLASITITIAAPKGAPA